jgi:hypothetical protein
VTAPLASTDALAARLGVSFTDTQTVRASELLADASATVRNYTRQDFTVATDTAYLEPTHEQWLFLPQRPVTAVSAVTIGGSPLAASWWTLQSDALFRYDGWAGYFPGQAMPWRQPNTIAVTYTHGYAVIPADIVAVVCKLAQAKWSNPQGFKTAAAGAISLSLDSGVTAGALDDADKAILDSYRRRRRSVQLAARLI